MSLSFGLNVKAKSGSKPTQPPPRKKASIFDDSDSDNGDDGKATHISNEEAITTIDFSSSRPSKSREHKPAKAAVQKDSVPPSQTSGANDYRDLASERAATAKAVEAETEDSSIFDYDSFHAAQTAVRDARKAAARVDAEERKPKYMTNLLDAAARRKQDQLVAREKVLQRERAAEGDEFADKEKFVTGAYKKQQEEARKVEEEEAKKAEEEKRRRGRMGGGMQGFYRGVLGDDERRHEEEKAAVEEIERKGGVTASDAEIKPSDREMVEEMRRKGVAVTLNEAGEVTDKRQLLSAGLNVGGGSGSRSNGAEHLRTRRNEAGQGNDFGRRQGYDPGRAARDRQTRQMEAQLEAAAKRKAEEEDEERDRAERAAKSRKTEQDKASARERFLARKREREAAKAKAQP